MKALWLLAPLAALLSSCASFQSSQQIADYNGDGLLSDAEVKQFNKQASVQERNVYRESVQRRNLTNTVRDTNQAIWGLNGIIRGIRSF